MKNNFLRNYSTWAGNVSLPIELTEYFMSQYSLTELNKSIELWTFEDFNTYTTKPYILRNLVESRFRRLNPIIASMGFLTSYEILSLWIVEHMEKDLHIKNLNQELPKDETKKAIKMCIQQGLTYADIGQYYLKKRFTT